VSTNTTIKCTAQYFNRYLGEYCPFPPKNSHALVVKQYKLENMSSNLVLLASIRYPELCAYQIFSVPKKASK